MKTRHRKRKDIVKAIRLVWDSLESHIDATIKSPDNKEHVGGRRFHKKCVEEYHFIIGVLIGQLK
jgi:hypothetical protein